MLSEISIRNIALIRSAEFSFAPGFNVLTGETGAGKSILIGAIGAVLGFRTSKALIRTGEEQAAVSALFREVSPGARSRLAELGIECDGELLLSRTITADSSVCRVNGQTVTAAMLRQAGALLMNIHGQTDTQMLSDTDHHREFVDAFGGLAPERESYLALFERLRGLQRRLSRLETDSRERERRLDLLRYQNEEISAAALNAGEEEELQARRRVIRGAEQLTEWLTASRVLLAGDDDADGAETLLTRAAADLGRAGEMLPGFEELSRRLEGFAYEVQDAAEQVRDALDTLEFDPRELDRIEERLDLIGRLKRKYGATVEEVLAYGEAVAKELEELENADVTADALRQEVEAALMEAKEAAARLTQRRLAAAKEFSGRVQKELEDLDMGLVSFTVERAETPLSETGADELAFMLSVNPGEEPRRLSEIASGGERSRIMLAIKNVISGVDDLGTLIFDEIDAGISGKAAQKVGAKLRLAARERQILCVTHLAQVAAFADHHLLIEKSESGGRTYTHVTPLDTEARIRELARIMSGELLTDTALQNAAELYEYSQKGLLRPAGGS